jgi:nucleotide-binding universal stress UspA family protein
MYRKILIPLDGSKVAEAVLPYARFLATALQLPVDLIHVNDPETAAPNIPPTHGTDYLKRVADSFPRSLTVNCRIDNGRAAEVIIDSGAGDAGTLITMATHGLSGGQRWLLGRVSQKVLQASVNPLLLIRPMDPTHPDREARLSTVIVPLDGSHLAEKILPHIAYLAKGLGLPVVLIRTYTLPTAGYFLAAGVPLPAMDEVGSKIEGEIKAYLQAKEEELRASGIASVSSVAVEGRGPEEIIDLARRTPDSLVAMSTHGRSGMGRWVLGGVTDRVVCYCGEPVLVIRPISP